MGNGKPFFFLMENHWSHPSMFVFSFLGDRPAMGDHQLLNYQKLPELARI